MNEASSNPIEPLQLDEFRKAQGLTQQLNNGVGWFFWIAGLSMINTIIFLLDGQMTFIIGLGLTQVVDGLASGLAERMSANGAGLIQAASLVLDAVIAGIFVLYGVMGRRKLRWAVIAGMVIYALDGVIFVILRDWAPLAFHAIGLFFLWRGLLAMNKLIAFEQPAASNRLGAYLQAGAIETVDTHRSSPNLALNIVAILGTLLLAALTIGAFALFLLN